ncbi:MAG: hypothetical protein ABW157_21400 [Candidatus Thiodiazotropha sp. LLP2]
MGLTTETALRGALVLLPWVILIIAVYLTLNRSNPDRPMLSKRNSILLIVLGLLLYLTGIILINAGILEGVIEEFKIVGWGYKTIGILLVFIGYVGRNYKLVKIKR